MIMRKNEYFSFKKSLTPTACRLLQIGLVLIYASLFRLIFEITSLAPFTAAKAEYFGRMLEFPVAALAVLTVATYLTDRVTRKKDT